METAMLGLLAETSIHPGTGRGLGVVDLPVARESATDYPVIVGSSLKGALRDKQENKDKERAKSLYGEQEQAGDLLVSDGRLLLLPVRSLTGAYRWATCPHLIERYRRDLERAGHKTLPEVREVERYKALAANAQNTIYLEERQFEVVGAPETENLAKAIAPLLRHEETKRRLEKRIVVLNDDDFAWFARYGLSIQARNQLDDNTKQSKNLWYEETLPPDTVMYALVLGRDAGALESIDGLFPDSDPYLQAGGNETVGQGWFAVNVLQSDAGGETNAD